MASSYAPADAIALVQAFGHGIPVAAVQANLCDAINNVLWVYYPWGWSISSLTAINLVDGTQDYTPTNTDILRPLKMRIVRTDVTPNEFRELDMLANLSPELSRRAGVDTMKGLGWFRSQNFFRFDVAVSVGTGQTLQLQGEYQKVPVKITDANLSTPFAFPDHYYQAFVEGLLWRVYQLADDPRTGNVQKDSRSNWTATGQLGIFMMELAKMARTEDLGVGDAFMFPETPFGVGRSFWPGIFGI